ncbi:carboxymuconolactone decarboxylase family protein [Gemmata sp.]|uniref:carboxymuconolactone decarboxylase family protein n=1 Tax=Gemmata sp. TaxID=1914242 RepID=UPI003F71F9E9
MDASEFRVGAAVAVAEGTTALTDREKHLIGLAVTLTRGCQACTGRRLRVAQDAGIPYAALVAAIDLSAAVNAGVTLRTAIEGATQAGIGGPCTGPECVVGVGAHGDPSRHRTQG